MWLFRNNLENLNADQTAHLDELKQANLITVKGYLFKPMGRGSQEYPQPLFDGIVS